MNWFQHDTDSTQDAKIKKLLIRHGAIGYAVYFHCLELIASDISESNLTFELEHDSEIIASNLFIKGTADKSGIEIVEQVMRDIIDLGLFSESDGRVFCLKLLKRINMSMTSNPTFRTAINNKKEQYHDTVMIHHDNVMSRHETLPTLPTLPTKKDTPDKPAKYQKHKLGEYGNVFLTNDERIKLGQEWGTEEFERMIKQLDEGIQKKGYKYTDFNLTLRDWKRNDKSTPIPKPNNTIKYCTHKESDGFTCGGVIKGSACTVCFTNYDYQGKEI